MQVVHCHIRLLKHLGSTGAIAELVKRVFDEDPVTPITFRDQEAVQFEAILQADWHEDVTRANGATTLCRCVNLIGLPITAPTRVRCLMTHCSQGQLQHCHATMCRERLS